MGIPKIASFSTNHFIVNITLCTFWCLLRGFICDCLSFVGKNTNIFTLHICVWVYVRVRVVIS
jgi:hypothetical protein